MMMSFVLKECKDFKGCKVLMLVIKEFGRKRVRRGEKVVLILILRVKRLILRVLRSVNVNFF